MRKGVQPNEYMDSCERLDETQLPTKKSFYSKVNKTDISDEDYLHAKTVWTLFDCNTHGDCHDYIIRQTYYFQQMCLKHIAKHV